MPQCVITSFLTFCANGSESMFRLFLVAVEVIQKIKDMGYILDKEDDNEEDEEEN